MRKARKFTKGSVGRVRVIEDFLPSPDDLVARDDNVKVTLQLSRRSVDFFKREATKHHTQYQRMIRRLLDAGVERQPQAFSPHSTQASRGRTTRKGRVV